jgi:hypothetical protein
MAAGLFAADRTPAHGSPSERKTAFFSATVASHPPRRPLAYGIGGKMPPQEFRVAFVYLGEPDDGGGIVKGLGRDRFRREGVLHAPVHFHLRTGRSPENGDVAPPHPYSESCPPRPGLIDETIEFEVAEFEARDDLDKLAVVDAVISYRAEATRGKPVGAPVFAATLG